MDDLGSALLVPALSGALTTGIVNAVAFTASRMLGRGPSDPTVASEPQARRIVEELKAEFTPVVDEFKARQLLAMIEGRDFQQFLRLLVAAEMSQGASIESSALAERYQLIVEQSSWDDPTGLDLYQVLVRKVELVVAIAEANGFVSDGTTEPGDEASLAVAYLESISTHLSLLTSRSVRSQQGDYEDYERVYRKAVRHANRYITPQQAASNRRVPILDLHVPPNLVPTYDVQGRGEPVPYEEFAGRIDRVAILGDPGGGKSTLASRIAYDLAAPDLVSYTPIVCVLREYGRAKKEPASSSILEYLTRHCETAYQLSAPPPDFFEWLLSSGRGLIIFDGLDELLDTSQRGEIRTDIELFGRRFATTPILVTSRRVGYSEAPLDPREYASYQLSAFSDDQVQDYARRWFAADDSLIAERARAMADAFFEDSAVVFDVRKNPLMLSLMCSLYRVERYIPRNRPDVFEKCTLMLFEQWDKKRGIHVALPFDSHARPAMQYLAFQIFSSDVGDEGVSRSRIVEYVTTYLVGRVYDDRGEAGVAAEQFVDFCTGRAWVFSDVGAPESGEERFQFTHRTFLEYFTARHLVRTHVTPRDLLDVLLPRVSRAEWDMVAQLAVQIQNANIEGAGDQILSGLLEASSDGRPRKETANQLAFCARVLGFLLPSPAIVKAVVVGCLDDPTPAFPGSVGNSDASPFAELMSIRGEAWSRVARSTLDWISAGLSSLAEGGRAMYALDRAYAMIVEFPEPGPGLAAEARTLVQSDIVRVREVVRGQRGLSAFSVHLGVLSCVEVLEEFGLGPFVELVPVRSAGGFYAPIGHTWLGDYTEAPRPGALHDDDRMVCLTRVGVWSAGQQPPYALVSDDQSLATVADEQPPLMLSGMALRGAVVVACCLVEQGSSSSRTPSIPRRYRETLGEPFWEGLKARVSDQTWSSADYGSVDVGPGGDAFCREFDRWARKEVDFVDRIDGPILADSAPRS